MNISRHSHTDEHTENTQSSERLCTAVWPGWARWQSMGVCMAGSLITLHWYKDTMEKTSVTVSCSLVMPWLGQEVSCLCVFQSCAHVQWLNLVTSVTSAARPVSCHHTTAGPGKHTYTHSCQALSQVIQPQARVSFTSRKQQHHKLWYWAPLGTASRQSFIIFHMQWCELVLINPPWLAS